MNVRSDYFGKSHLKECRQYNKSGCWGGGGSGWEWESGISYCTGLPRQGVVSECQMFYAVPTARVIFTAKTSLDVSSLSREQVWTFSVFG